MDDLHITIEPERIVTPTLILRSWSAEDAQGAFEKNHAVQASRITAASHKAATSSVRWVAMMTVVVSGSCRSGRP
jgi:hypothetical protein